jgi:hypothetical protein
MLFLVMGCCVLINVEAALHNGFRRMASLARASTMGQKRDRVVDYLEAHRDRVNNFGQDINHDDFSQAMREGQRRAEVIQGYEDELREHDVKFDPYKDDAKRVVDSLSDKQIDALNKRIDSVNPQLSQSRVQIDE